jgi:hypothetical protein
MFNSVQNARALLGSKCTYVVLPQMKASQQRFCPPQKAATTRPEPAATATLWCPTQRHCHDVHSMLLSRERISDNADDILIESVNFALSPMIHPNRTALTLASLISTASGRSKSWRRDRPIATDGLRPNIWSYGVPGKTQI